MRARLEVLATVTLVVAALTMAAVVVSREFSGPPTPAAPTVRSEPVYHDAWRALMDDGILIGDSGAPVMIVEFIDLECPFCRRFHEAFRGVKAEYGTDVALVVLHYPLSIHRFAEPAAAAAECADREGRFPEFLDVVFDKQDSLGLKSWGSYAAEAGVPDTAAFAACAVAGTGFPRVERGRELGDLLGVSGTPTVLVNGWEVRANSAERLSELVADALAGEGVFATREREDP